jgi:hypothetical protein
MVRKPKISQEVLAKPGADALAAMLLEEAARNLQLKRDLELALEAGKGASRTSAPSLLSRQWAKMSTLSPREINLKHAQGASLSVRVSRPRHTTMERLLAVAS